MEMKTLAMLCVFLVTAVSLLPSVPAADEDIFFDQSVSNCNTDHSVGKDDQVTLRGQRDPAVSTNSYTSCEITFKGSGINDRICIQFDTLSFNNGNLQLKYFDAQEATSNAPTAVYDSDAQFTVPMEICSTERYLSLQLASRPGITGIASIKDININLKIRNMHGNRRIAYLDCTSSQTRLLDESFISVLNRHDDRTANLPANCQLTFKYDGKDTNNTVCLQFIRHNTKCDYELKVHDGTAQSFRQMHTYSCTNDKPQNWCSDTKSFILEMKRTGSVMVGDEPASLFSLDVKDGPKDSGPGKNVDKNKQTVKGQVTFPTQPSSSFPIWGIIVIPLAVIVIIVIIIAVYCHKRAKDNYAPHEEHEAEKL